MVETVDAHCEPLQAPLQASARIRPVLNDSLGGLEIARHPNTEIFNAT